MGERGPSITARRVAAHRLRFDRIEADFGCPDDDDALTRRIAGGEVIDPADPMHRYLQARTRFFDRVVVNAITSSVRQVVNIGAGYDGRPWRYNAEGVCWWEVDLADTQHDKLAQLDQLGIEHGQVRFIEHDLAATGVASTLINNGLDADGATLFVCEGVVVYLEDVHVTNLLGELRSIAHAGSRLALSLRTTTPTTAGVQRRVHFDTAVASVGEPTLNTITVDAATSLFADNGWRPIARSTATERAGLVLAEPI